ncbi:hypothetical protein BN439_0929 [Erwinia amylovora Ea644]|nr:hypothetical protein BN439_0929 [Erwinia amylovora Ea644]
MDIDKAANELCKQGRLSQQFGDGLAEDRCTGSSKRLISVR